MVVSIAQNGPYAFVVRTTNIVAQSFTDLTSNAQDPTNDDLPQLTGGANSRQYDSSVCAGTFESGQRAEPVLRGRRLGLVHIHAAIGDEAELTIGPPAPS